MNAPITKALAEALIKEADLILEKVSALQMKACSLAPEPGTDELLKAGVWRNLADARHSLGTAVDKLKLVSLILARHNHLTDAAPAPAPEPAARRISHRIMLYATRRHPHALNQFSLEDIVREELECHEL